MPYKCIGENIRARRIQLKMTQDKLAEQSEISLSFLGHIERGTRKLSVDTLKKIADALDCTVDELMGRMVRGSARNRSIRELLEYALRLLQEEK